MTIGALPGQLVRMSPHVNFTRVLKWSEVLFVCCGSFSLLCLFLSPFTIRRGYFFFLFFPLLTISLTIKVLPIVHDDSYDNGNVQQIHIRTDILR